MRREDMMFEMLKSLNEKQDDQTKTLADVKADLKYHIKRTDLLEEAVSKKANKINWKLIGIAVGIAGSLVGIAAKFGII